MQDIPIHSKDLIIELQKVYRPYVVGPSEIASESDRLTFAYTQGKIDLVQELLRKLKRTESEGVMPE